MATKQKELTNVVREAFLRSGLSIKRWANDAGVPYASAHAIAAGTRDPRVTTLEKLAKELGLRLVALHQSKTKRTVKHGT